MHYVQVVLTDDHVADIREALAGLYVEGDERIARVQVLEELFTALAEHPAHFPPTGRMATAIKSRLRKLKGPAQPPRNPNKRKTRQALRQSFAKRRRQERREQAEAYNVAREALERDLEDIRRIAEERAERAKELMAQETLTHDEAVELLQIVTGA